MPTASYTLATPPHYHFKAIHGSHVWWALLPYRHDSATCALSRLEWLPNGQAVLLQINPTATGIVLTGDSLLSESDWAILTERMG